ncbi:MAG: twin-arginine translocase TatA/TatE family subunit [Helicobacteraceae bacterium]|jgi:sec-independent protein translocase protein TatA|nr:twin-arginine translocase TatA/TatE family subunit [Helicobacteraceae bacterium]
MGMPGMTEWVVILLIVLLLFGAKKIPELAKGLGSGIKNFKNAIKEDEATENKTIEANKEPTKTANTETDKVA